MMTEIDDLDQSAPDVILPETPAATADDARQLDVFDPLFLAVRLQWLYDHVPDPLTGERFNDYSLAERIGQVTKGRITVSAPALWGLRRGKHTPKWINMVAIAQAFHKNVSIFSEMPFDAFTETLMHMQEDERLLALMQQSGVRHIMLRAADLPTESLTTLATIIEQVQNLVALQATTTATPSS